MMSALLFPELQEPQAIFDYPVPLSEKYRPVRIQDFAGLAQPKLFLSAFALRPTDCGLLFIGSAGTGKTSMAMALAMELKAFVHHVPAGEMNIDKVRELKITCWHYPPMGYARHLIIADEADLMSVAAQNSLLSKLDGTDTIPNTVWVFTSNSTDRLEERFLSRCRQLAFSTYGIQADAARLLETVWDAESPNAEKPNFARIVKDQNGNVRAALMQIEIKLTAMEAL